VKNTEQSQGGTFMVVQHNMQAMNASRMLGVTTSAQSKATEKLSSGYRINRAADDAAGLTISEKMRKQIRGLDQASTNAQDGVSAVQTAEGALTEVHSMLQRMNELATQASNGTNSQLDRDAIQAEIDQLTTEIDRVAETTKFNETYLLKGNTAGKSSDVKVAAHDAGLAGKLGESVNGKATFTADELKVGSKVSIGGTEYNIVDSSKTSDYTSIKDYTPAAGDILVQEGKTYTYVDNGATTPGGQKAGAAGWFTDDNKTTTADTVTLKEGSTLTTKADGKTTTLVGSSSLTMDKAAASTPTWATGDTLVHDGKTYTKTATTNEWVDEEGNKVQNANLAEAGDTYTIKATGKEGQIDNDGISTVENIQDMIKAASDGDIIKIRNAADGTDKSYTVGVTTKEDGIKYTADDIAALVNAGDYVTDGNSKTYYAVPKASESANDITLKEAYSKMADELQKASSIGTDKAASVVNNGDGTFEITQGTVSVKDGLSFNLHVGADADMTNKITVNIDSMSAAGLGIKGLNVSDDTGVEATYAIDAIADAISKVSSQRSALGAVQNRLEHTISNVDNVVENTTSAESRIRDTDMADMMVEYSKNNILAQAGQSMLAQANQSTQGVLSLLS
jgi:flagellin-like hook-associated protein FlgL